MTQWLPISTYPHEGEVWGLFRGGQIDETHVELDSGFNPPCVVGVGNEWFFSETGPQLTAVLITHYDSSCAIIEYHNPTEWMPLDLVVGLIDECAVTAARFLI